MENQVPEEEVDTEEFVRFLSYGMITLFVSVVLLWLAAKLRLKLHPRPEGNAQPEGAQGQGAARRQAVNRRAAQGMRNRRGRRPGDSDSEGEDQGARPLHGSDDELEEKLNDPKLGAKKRAKLEAKAEKRQAREAEERAREERKAKQEVEMRERELREKQEAEAEKRREDEEKRAREEKARQEQEEYEKMKAMFSVEGEGCEAAAEEDEGNLIEKFIDHVKDKKVILFEELATRFGLKVPDAIDRLTTLVNEGRLTGVMDDRGKFIYISEEELGKFAKFIKQRGRVSIADLVENSATLITLTADSETSESTSST